MKSKRFGKEPEDFAFREKFLSVVNAACKRLGNF
jgi:hypothetical protein